MAASCPYRSPTFDTLVMRLSEQPLCLQSTYLLYFFSFFFRSSELVRQPAQPAGPGHKVGHVPRPPHRTHLRGSHLPRPVVPQPQPHPTGHPLPEHLRSVPLLYKPPGRILGTLLLLFSELKLQACCSINKCWMSDTQLWKNVKRLWTRK